MQVLQDPNRVNLRKAARATLVVPGVFAALIVTGNTPSALFGAFGCFSALVFSDYGGPLPRRLRAYLALAAVGAGLVALGTALADTIAPAVVVTLLVAFALSLFGALGGYFTASVTSATLAFVLAVMTPGVEVDLWSRELGWLVGVAVAGVAAVLLWPVHQRDRVRAAAVSALTEASKCLREPTESRDLRALDTASARLDASAGVVYRPSGPIAQEHALVALVVATRRLARLVDLLTTAERSPSADTLPEYAALRDRAASTLDAVAAVLAGDRSEPVDVDVLLSAREAHAAALEQWAAIAVAPSGADVVIDCFTAAFPLRRLSFAAVQIATSANAGASAGAAGSGGALAQAATVMRAHAHPRSVRFRNAARAGIGLAIAVLVAKEASVAHAFWVVLGALSVLRSSALGTGATALQALEGALAGFAIATLVMLTMGGDDTWLWIALPVVVFLAGYTPGAVNFVVGQAAFTVFVVVLFNILVPEGWRTGLVRVQDVAVGAGISVIVGALLWPRGARGVARRAFAELLRAGAHRLDRAFQGSLQGAAPEGLAGDAEVLEEAHTRAVAALEDLALEHGGGHVDREGWNTLLVDALLLEVAADGVLRARSVHGAPPGCSAAVAALDRERARVTDGVAREAEDLVRDGIGAVDTRPGAIPAVPDELGACLAAHADGDVHAAVGLVWVHEWLALADGHSRVAEEQARPAAR